MDLKKAVYTLSPQELFALPLFFLPVEVSPEKESGTVVYTSASFVLTAGLGDAPFESEIIRIEEAEHLENGKTLLKYSYISCDGAEKTAERECAVTATLTLLGYAPSFGRKRLSETEKIRKEEFVFLNAEEKRDLLSDKYLTESENEIRRYANLFRVLKSSEMLKFLPADIIENAADTLPEFSGKANGPTDALTALAAAKRGSGERRAVKKAQTEVEAFLKTPSSKAFFDRIDSLVSGIERELPPVSETAVNTYTRIASAVQNCLSEKGWSGEFPGYTNGEKYITFTVDGIENESGGGILPEVSAAFGDAEKEFSIFGGKRIHFDFQNCTGEETEDIIKDYINGITDALDGKKISGAMARDPVISRLSAGAGPLLRSLGLFPGAALMCFGIIMIVRGIFPWVNLRDILSGTGILAMGAVLVFAVHYFDRARIFNPGFMFKKKKKEK